MKKQKLKKIMGQLDKKIKANTTWNNIDVEQFTGQFRGVEKGICLNCEKPVDQDANICHSCYFKKVMGGKQQITDIHQAEAERLIEVFLGLKIYNAKSYYIKSEFELIFKNAQENALKCQDEIIKELKYAGRHKHSKYLRERIEFQKSVIQVIEDYE